MSMVQYVTFMVGGGVYGMNVEHVSAIEAPGFIVPVPNTSPNILGLVNLRGDVLPVYSLRRKFGHEETADTAQTKILVTKSNDIQIAYKVDMVKDIFDCTPDMITKFPAIASTPGTVFIDGVVNRNGQLILLVDENRFIGEEEGAAISKMVEENRKDN